MPALITHHLLGAEVVNDRPKSPLPLKLRLRALLGKPGSDPLARHLAWPKPPLCLHSLSSYARRPYC